MASGVSNPLLTFCDQTGQVVEIDTRGNDAAVLEPPPPNGCQLQGSESILVDSDESGQPRGRGRSTLGVVAREVTLLPRNSDWLAIQPGGASGTLQKLVEEARRANVDRDRQRQTRECAYHFMSGMAGDVTGFEEATRAVRERRGKVSTTDRSLADRRSRLRQVPCLSVAAGRSAIARAVTHL